MVSFFDMGHLVPLGNDYTRGLMTENYRIRPIFIVDLVKLTVAYATGELSDNNLIGTRVREINFNDVERSLFFWYNSHPCTRRHNIMNPLLLSVCHFNR
jgi:hypothetical protein